MDYSYALSVALSFDEILFEYFLKTKTKANCDLLDGESVDWARDQHKQG